MLFRKTTLRFLKREFGVKLDQLYLNIFEDCSFILKISVPTLLSRCAKWLDVNFVTSIPSEFEPDLLNGIKIKKHFALQGKINDMFITYGICPSTLESKNFYLTSGSALLDFIRLKTAVKWHS